MLASRPKVQRRWLVAGEGGTTEFWHEVTTTASPCCLIRAQYELHEVTTELSKQRKEEEKVSVVVGRGELHSGEVRPWRRRRKKGQWPSPRARMAQLEGRRGRGGHGGAVVELEVVFLRRRAS